MTRTFYISEVNGDTSFQNVTLNIVPHRQFILVSGLFYPDDHNNYKLSGSFSKFAKDYAKKIVQNRKNDDIIIHNVDILEGVITKTEYIGNNPPKESFTKFDKVVNSDYKMANNSIRFDNSTKKIISKTDIYKLIEEIGKTDANTLEEVNIFSHAYWNGPILVNTDSGANDCDMRRNDTSVIDSTNFTNAFSTNGIIKIWGCSFPTATNALFSKFRNNKSYSSTSTISDSTIFTFSANSLFYHPEGGTPIDLTPQINAALKTTYKVTDIIKLSFLEIKKILIFNYLNVYAGVIASKYGIKVQATLPATYANISPNFHVASSTLANVTMYKKHLEVQLGELNYGIFDDATVKKLEIIYNS